MTDSLKERLRRWDGCMQCAEMARDVTEALAHIEELEQEANNYKFALFSNQGVHNQHMANAEATIAKLEDERDTWKARCEKMWDERDKPFNAVIIANLKLATLQGKLDRAVAALNRLANDSGPGVLDYKSFARSILSDLSPNDQSHEYAMQRQNDLAEMLDYPSPAPPAEQQQGEYERNVLSPTEAAPMADKPWYDDKPVEGDIPAVRMMTAREGVEAGFIAYDDGVPVAEPTVAGRKDDPSGKEETPHRTDGSAKAQAITNGLSPQADAGEKAEIERLREALEAAIAANELVLSQLIGGSDLTARQVADTLNTSLAKARAALSTTESAEQ